MSNKGFIVQRYPVLPSLLEVDGSSLIVDICEINE